MYYDAELTFLRNILKHMRLQTLLIRSDEIPVTLPDHGLRRFLGQETDYTRTFQEAIQWAKENTIYKLTDAYLCKYMFLHLPDTPSPTVLLIGPYMAFSMSHQQVLEEAERLLLSPVQFRQLEGYYSNIPVVSEESTLLAAITSFAEHLWGEGQAYKIVDINQDVVSAPVSHPGHAEQKEKEDILLQMNITQKRYDYENELMDAVSKGLTHRAEMMLGGSAQLPFEQRMADPLRNAKNYCIICNSLMRKAAEKGGVHPIHLDSTSSAFAREIEALGSVNGVKELMLRMVRSYCRLVRRHTSGQYSAPVQKTVTLIHSDLSGDLSLTALAAAQEINASYLSSLFKRDTGRTVTDYVNQARVNQATKLLSGTKLQVQTIAQHCGISDVNYFSKIFKKYMGMTPKEYRRRTQENFIKKE